MTNETPPIEVSKNAVTLDQIASIVRSRALVVGAFGTLVSLLKGGDLAAVIAWVRSSEAATAGSGAFAWDQLKVRHRARQVVSVSADDRVPPQVARLR